MLGAILKNFKNIVIAGAIITVAALGYTLYTDYKEKDRLHQELIGQTEKYKQLNDYTAKLETKYKDQKDLVTKLNNEWSEVVKGKDERIELLSDATFLMGQYKGRQDGPDYYYQTPKGTRNYVLNELRISGEDSPPVGYIMIKNDGRTYKRTYEFEIEVKNLQTIDEETGRIKVYSKAFLISKETSPLAKRIDGYKDWKDIPYPLKIVGGEVIVDPTKPNELKPKVFWWNPKFGLAVNGIADKEGLDGKPALEFSTSSYGNTEADSKFKFNTFGVGTTGKEEIDLYWKPVLWRPFNMFPNTYIGPGIGIDSKGNTELMFGISVGF